MSLREMNGYTPEAFESWLSDLFVKLYTGTPEERVQASDLSEFGVQYEDYILDGLELLFKKLQPKAKTAFRQGLGALLTHAEPGDFPDQGMVDLISLVAHVRAHGQLETLESVLTSGDWGELVPELYAVALGVLKSLCKGNEAYEATQRMVTSVHFPPCYVFDAFEILIEKNSVHWDEDLLQISARMNAFSQHVAEHGSEEDKRDLEARYISLANQMLVTLTPHGLASGIARLTHRPALLRPEHAVGRLIGLMAQGVPLGQIVYDLDERRAKLKLSGGDQPIPLKKISSHSQLFFEDIAKDNRARMPVQEEHPTPQIGPSIREAVQVRQQNAHPPARHELAEHVVNG